MKKLRIVLLCAALLCTLSLFGCTRGITDKDIADNTYIYEGDGFGGDFSIALQKDGTMSYYEGMLSSHIGVGTWTLEDGILSISEGNGRGGQRVNRFRVEEDALIFLKDGSANFIYLHIEDGERFLLTGKFSPSTETE